MGYSEKAGNKSRLDLSKEAIKMFFSKMRSNDAFGLVTFDNNASIVVPCQRKDSLD